jgi:hypothetical protein
MRLMFLICRHFAVIPRLDRGLIFLRIGLHVRKGYKYKSKVSATSINIIFKISR